MDCNQDKITAFDTIFSTNQISILKIALPYFAPPLQKALAVFIKILELEYTMQYIKPSSLAPFSTNSATEYDFKNLIKEILPYCDEQKHSELEQIFQLFDNFETYQNLMKTMEFVNALNPQQENNFSETPSEEKESINNFSSTENGNFPDVTELLMNMLSPEQKEMYQFFKGENHDN